MIRRSLPFRRHRRSRQARGADPFVAPPGPWARNGAATGSGVRSSESCARPRPRGHRSTTSSGASCSTTRGRHSSRTCRPNRRTSSTSTTCTAATSTCVSWRRMSHRLAGRADAPRRVDVHRPLRVHARLRAMADRLRLVSGSHDLPGDPARRHAREPAGEAGHLREEPAVRLHAVAVADGSGAGVDPRRRARQAGGSSPTASTDRSSGPATGGRARPARPACRVRSSCCSPPTRARRNPFKDWETVSGAAAAVARALTSRRSPVPGPRR